MGKIKLVGKSGFTTIPNDILRNNQLSLKAKGLFAYMWSLPDNWDYSVAGLVKLLKEGRDSINGALKELEKEGYLVREYKRNSGKYSDIDYFLTPYPEKKEDLPITEKPISVNPQQINTNITKEEKKKENSLPTEEKGETSSPTSPSKKKSSVRSTKDKRKRGGYRYVLADSQYALIQDALRRFIKYLKGMNNTPSVDRLETWAKFLVEEADGDPEIAYAIVDKSMENSWQDLYKLDGSYKKRKSHRYRQRIKDNVVSIPAGPEDYARNENGELIVF